ncbi:hypothetical protein HN51_026091, partial [Arachis hypogaea]
KITTDIYARTVFITLLHIHTKGKDLVRLGMTHFATSYLTLGCLNDNKVVICLSTAYPFLHVLRMVDSKEKSAIGFIYEEIKSAKEKIRDAFQGVETNYIPIWDIIDARWGNQFHRLLHDVDYYLNPQIYYSYGFKIVYELKKQFYSCMERMIGKPDLITKMDVQLEDFKTQKEFFGSK